MSSTQINIFRKAIVLIFVLITTLSLLFIGITYFATTHFYQEGTQLLSKDVAAHIAKFTSPFGKEGIDKQKADSVFYNAMVVSPSAEIYFLDTAGKVIAYHADENLIRQWNIPLKNIREHILSGGKSYAKGEDPRDPDHPKIFSAAEVFNGSHPSGYIYVILGSKEYRSVTQLLFNSHIAQLSLEAFCIIIIISFVISLLYINRLKKRFNQMIRILERFQEGDFSARFSIKDDDELAPVTNAFNKMADMLVYNIDRLKKSETERKVFIANISHDLRTPLSVARGYSETLLLQNQHSLFTPERDDYMQLVLNKIYQVENMVDQLFELSKMEASEYKPRKEPFIFSEVLQELVDTSKLSASKNMIHIECSAKHDNSWIHADIGMMERVIQNLLYNSIKYTPRHGKIKIVLEKLPEELVFHIENDGEPLPEELINWINNDDQNVTNNRPAKTGLGLAIVKKILQLHNFMLEAKSSAISGNLFSVRMNLYSSRNS